MTVSRRSRFSCGRRAISEESALRSSSDGGCNPEKFGIARVDNEGGLRNPGWMFRGLGVGSNVLCVRRSDVIAASNEVDRAFVRIGSGTRVHVRSTTCTMRSATYVRGGRP